MEMVGESNPSISLFLIMFPYPFPQKKKKRKKNVLERLKLNVSSFFGSNLLWWGNGAILTSWDPGHLALLPEACPEPLVASRESG